MGSGGPCLQFFRGDFDEVVVGIEPVDVSVDEEVVEECLSSCFVFGLDTLVSQFPYLAKG
jgi:hypothetical protein